MWPFTVRVLQDQNPIVLLIQLMSIIAQILSAMAIAYAGIVAGKFQSRKDELARIKILRYYNAQLKLFNESMSAYFAESFAGEVLPYGYSLVDLWKQICIDFNTICEKKYDIAMNLPDVSIEPFQIFIDSFHIVEINYHARDEVMANAWDYPEKNLKKVIKFIEEDIESSNKRNHRIFQSPKKSVTAK